MDRRLIRDLKDRDGFFQLLRSNPGGLLSGLAKAFAYGADFAPLPFKYGKLPELCDKLFRLRKYDNQLPGILYVQYVLAELISYNEVNSNDLLLLAGLFCDLGEFDAIELNIDKVTQSPYLRNFLKLGRTAPNATNENKYPDSKCFTQCTLIAKTLGSISNKEILDMSYSIKNSGHEEISIEYAKNFMSPYFNKDEIDKVCYLIKWHMSIYFLDKMNHEDDIKEMILNSEFNNLKYLWMALYNARKTDDKRITVNKVNEILKKNQSIQKIHAT